jgi:hypothetical protein
MSVQTKEIGDLVLCAECGHPGDALSTIPTLDGTVRRCANVDQCEERKEARASFTGVW